MPLSVSVSLSRTHTDLLSKPQMLMTHSVTCYQRTFHRGHVQKEKYWCDLLYLEARMKMKPVTSLSLGTVRFSFPFTLNTSAEVCPTTACHCDNTVELFIINHCEATQPNVFVLCLKSQSNAQAKHLFFMHFRRLA